MSTLELENIKHPDNSGNNIELAADGKIGIGIAPSSALHVKTPAFIDSILTLDSTSTNVSQRINFSANGTIQSQIYDDAVQTKLFAVTNKHLAFGTNNNERMRVASDGNVGIGTNTPLRKLHLADAGDTHIILQSTNAVDNSEIFEIGAGANSASKVDLTFRTRLNSGSGGTEHMRITNDGYVTTPNQVSFYARVSGSWSSVGNAVEIVPAAAFNTTPLWNNGNGFSGNRFTAPIAGKYMFIFSAEKANNENDATFITIHKNGSEIPNARIYHATQDHRKTLQYTMIMDLAVNDYAEPFTNSYRSGVAWDNRGQFAGYLIG